MNRRELRWFAGAAAAAFLVPFVFSSLLDLDHDLYLAIYFSFVIGLRTLYSRSTELDIGEVLRRHWRWEPTTQLCSCATFTVCRRALPFPTRCQRRSST